MGSWVTPSGVSFALLLASVGATPQMAPTETKLVIVRGGNLWRLDPATGATTQLTTSGDCSEPAFSPDRQRLVYVRTVGDTYADQATYLWVLDIATGKARRLSGANKSHVSPRWSPDGKWIAYLAQDRPDFAQFSSYALLKIPPTGEGAIPLCGGIVGVVCLAWSPDSRQIAYARSSEGQGDISVIGAEDGRVVKERLYVVSANTPEVWIDDLDWPDPPHIVSCEHVLAAMDGDRSRVRLCQVGLDGIVRSLFDQSPTAHDEYGWRVSSELNQVWVVRRSNWEADHGGSLWVLESSRLTKIADDVWDVSAY
jgi:Tol biopolymer transport system component